MFTPFLSVVIYSIVFVGKNCKGLRYFPYNWGKIAAERPVPVEKKLPS